MRIKKSRVQKNIEVVFQKTPKRIKITCFLSFILLFVATLGYLESIFEKNAPNANITTPFEGIWWAFVSITTFGYGDRFPITPIGRLIGAVLMLGGITMFSVLIAYIAYVVIDKIEHKTINKISKKLNILEKKIDRMIGVQEENKVK